MGLLQKEQGLSLTLLSALEPFLPIRFPCPALIEEDVPSFTVTWLILMGGLPFLEEKGKSGKGGGWKERREEKLRSGCKNKQRTKQKSKAITKSLKASH